jgi:hypothetical protein
VTGRLLADGRRLAERIQLLEDAAPRRFRFTGTVTSLDPWVVGGIPLVVDANTTIDGNVAAGDLVRAHGVILPDGTWRADRIRRLERNRGCLSLSTVVRSMDDDQIVLLDWQALQRSAVTVTGEVRVATVVIVSGCIGEDGTLVIVNVIVIHQLDQLPVIVLPQPGGGGGGGNNNDDDDDDDDDDD